MIKVSLLTSFYLKVFHSLSRIVCYTGLPEEGESWIDCVPKELKCFNEQEYTEYKVGIYLRLQ